MISPFAGTFFIFLIAQIHGQQPVTRVILMPNDDGHTSVLEVTTAKQTVSIDQPFQVVEVSSNSKPVIKIFSAQAVKQNFPEVLQQMPLAEEKFNLFFLPGDTELTVDSVKTLETLLSKVKSRPNGRLVLVGRGLIGDPSTGSLNRALTLKAVIQAKADKALQIHAFGRDDRPSTANMENAPSPQRQGKVEVILR